MTTPQLKFTYFPILARGELSRLVLTYGKIPFEDNRVDFSQWGAMKPNTPLGKLPLLEVDGTSYCQSMAIVRYAAKLGGLYPEDPLECLRVEMVSETLCELSADCIDIVFIEKDEIKKVEKTNTLLQETIPFKLGVLTKLIKGDYFVGDKVSFADIQVFDLFENALSKFSAGFTATTYPELDAIVKRVKENTEISAYLKKHSP